MGDIAISHNEVMSHKWQQQLLSVDTRLHRLLHLWSRGVLPADGQQGQKPTVVDHRQRWMGGGGL
jgi:hypothetical protein